MRRAERFAAVYAALVLLCLYLAWPEKVFVFDGVMFGYIIERRVADLGAALFNRRHLLFNPLLMHLRDALTAGGAVIGGYELIQRVNAVAGALGVWVFSRIVRRLTGDEWTAAAAALCLGVGACYWSRAVEGQVYMLMTLGTLGTLWACLIAAEKEGPVPAIVVCSVWTASILIHAASVFLFPAVLTSLWLGTKPSARGTRASILFGSGGIVAVCYLAAFKIRNTDSLLSFFRAATEFRAAAGGGGGGFGTIIHDFFFRSGVHPVSLIVDSFSSLGESLAFKAGAVVGVLCVAALAAAKRSWPSLDASKRRAVLIVGLWGGAFVVLDFFWPGGIYFWTLPAAAFTILLVMFLPRRPVPLAVAALLLGAWNLRAGVLPQSRIENNAGWRSAQFVKTHTASTCWVATSGLGFPNSKVYLSQFARRSTRVLEYDLRSAPKGPALANFKAFMNEAASHGLPVYILSDMVDDAAVRENLEQIWGVAPRDLDALFADGRLERVASDGAGLSIYAFVPASRRPELFAGLTFNVLDMNDAGRVEESLTLLEETAALMSPAEKKRAVELLQRTNFGALLTFEGLAPYMDPASREAGKEYARHFAPADLPQTRAALERIKRSIVPQAERTHVPAGR